MCRALCGPDRLQLSIYPTAIREWLLCSHCIDEKTEAPRSRVICFSTCPGPVTPSQEPLLPGWPGDSGAHAPDPPAAAEKEALDQVPRKRDASGPPPTLACSSGLTPPAPSLQHQLPCPSPILPASPAGSSQVVPDDIGHPPARDPPRQGPHEGQGHHPQPPALRTGQDVGFPGRKSQVCGFGPCSASLSRKSGSFRSKDFSLSQRRLLRGQGGLDTKLASSGGCEFSAAGRVQGDTGRSPGKNATEGTWGPAGRSRRLSSPPPEETLCHWGSRWVLLLAPGLNPSWDCARAFFHLPRGSSSANSHQAALSAGPPVCAPRGWSRAGRNPQAAGLIRLLPLAPPSWWLASAREHQHGLELHEPFPLSPKAVHAHESASAWCPHPGPRVSPLHLLPR